MSESIMLASFVVDMDSCASLGLVRSAVFLEEYCWNLTRLIPGW